ncbi:GNAT family N-acetyltransferase [Montanilutibacter psychrotolerans]|nr:GNAT family N-acetyltransferase [Lysobacter psychrotolerans]
MGITVRWGGIEDLDAHTYAAWSELGERAREATPFLMPQFIVPAARWLSPRPLRVALFQRGRELVGVGCFSAERPNPFAPVPHLLAYCTLHSFRTGLLVAPDEADGVAHALLAATRYGPLRGHAIALRAVPEDDDGFAALRRAACDAGGAWRELSRFARPILHLAPDTTAVDGISHKLLKSLRRHRRRLAEQAPYSSRLVRAGPELRAATERHLSLEHHGWKGERGSSMLSCPASTAFFRELVERFDAIGAVVFSEVLAGDEVVGSSSNLLVGRTLSAFKIGWHPARARYSPGLLTELALLESIETTWPHVEKFDSNAAQDSYLSQMLPHSEAIVSGFVATGRTGRLALGAGRVAHPFARALGLQPWHVPRPGRLTLPQA